ncbi:hypothetical protein [Aestuariivirga sp.]|uniref:hypothetical protein n=1 Tax=Aestuariivirga sp. TaxID=2650926 RepID=UPI0039E544FE
MVERAGHGLVPRTGTASVPVDATVRQQLLLERPDALEAGRVALYVCSQCGGYDCGVISARVTREDHQFIWSDLGVERPGELQEVPFIPLTNIGPFRFAEGNYRAALETRLE